MVLLHRHDNALRRSHRTFRGTLQSQAARIACSGDWAPNHQCSAYPLRTRRKKKKIAAWPARARPRKNTSSTPTANFIFKTHAPRASTPLKQVRVPSWFIVSCGSENHLTRTTDTDKKPRLLAPSAQPPTSIAQGIYKRIISRHPRGTRAETRRRALNLIDLFSPASRSEIP